MCALGAPVQQGSLAGMDEAQLSHVSAVDADKHPKRLDRTQASSRAATHRGKIVLSMGGGIFLTFDFTFGVTFPVTFLHSRKNAQKR